MDSYFAAAFLLIAATLPWALEVFFQVRLLARFIAELPPHAREALPRHPRRPALAFLGSARFHLAIWRAFRRDLPTDSPELLRLKRRMRTSLKREILWVVILVGALVMLRAGL